MLRCTAEVQQCRSTCISAALQLHSQRVMIGTQPASDFVWSESERTTLSMVRNFTIVDNVQSFIQATICQVQFIIHGVSDQGHVGWKWKGSQFRCCSKTVLDCTMLVDEVVARKCPTISWMRFFDVDNDEVGDVGVVGSHSTDAVEGTHERRSGAAAEDDDERP